MRPVTILCSGNKGEETFTPMQGKGLREGSVEDVILKLRLKKEWNPPGACKGTGLYQSAAS